MPWALHRSRQRDVYLLELDDRLTPPGLAVEVQVLLVDGRSWAALVLSETGAVMNLARAGRA